MKRFFAWVAVAVPVSIPAQIFLDDFEAPSISPAPYQMLSSGSTFGDWTVTSGNVDIVGTGYWPGAGQVIDLNGNQAGSIATGIATDAGQKYSITWRARPNGTPPSTITSKMSWGGNDYTWTITMMGLHGPATITMERIVLGNGSDTLRFSGITPSTGGWMIDDVMVSAVDNSTPLSTPGTQIIPSTVPEPGEWAAAASIGLIGFAAYRRTRKMATPGRMAYVLKT